MNKMLQNYQKGMSAFDNCHNSTVRSQWVALTDEIGEFVNEPSLSEIWDILQAAGRLCYKLSGIPFNLLAYPIHSRPICQTVYKRTINSSR